jgi:hypothetical protein
MALETPALPAWAGALGTWSSHVRRYDRRRGSLDRSPAYRPDRAGWPRGFGGRERYVRTMLSGALQHRTKYGGVATKKSNLDPCSALITSPETGVRGLGAVR